MAYLFQTHIDNKDVYVNGYKATGFIFFLFTMF